MFVRLLILRAAASVVAQIMKGWTHPRGIIIVRASDPGGVCIPVSTIVIFSRLNSMRLRLGVNGIPLIFAIMIGA